MMADTTVTPCPVDECGGTGMIPAAWMHVPPCIHCAPVRRAEGGRDATAG